MKVRDFYLINGNGEKYPLLRRSAFLHSPSGLGWTESTTYQRIGDQFAALNIGFNQANPTGAVFFPIPNSYRKYYDFIRFTEIHPLILVYKPNQTEYKMNVRVHQIEKKEIEDVGLNCAISFLGLTHWYREEIVYNNYEVESGEKIYNYTYNYRYGGSSGYSMQFMNDSIIESPIKLTIIGPTANPRWVHIVNDEIVGTGSINASIPEEMKLVIDTTSVPYSIKQYDMAGREVTDLYGTSNFDTKRFMFAGEGRNIIYVSDDEEIPPNAFIEVHITYASV